MKHLTLFIISICFQLLSFAQHATTIQSSPETPFVLGSVVQIHSNILQENRTLNIYLPDGYNKNDTVKYPVIYLLDGSADEDFIHVVGLVQFDNFSWVNRLPKSIVVGIANVNRQRDFTYPSTLQENIKAVPTSGHSEKFIDFLDKELQPFIENKYKVNNSRTLIGESLGGLLATEILLKRSNLFNKYIIISPSLWWDNGSLLNLPFSGINAINHPLDIYIGVGKEGLTPGKNPRVMEVDANLLADKLNSYNNKNIKVYFDYLPDENHATISHQALSNAFRRLNP